ncbi:PIN domain-like protein [Ephemerocybe angulata]|uniref:PIN domain-like protein n=1 Tax=Ephemerocybe angulata TaxID=980116 RepID=A0A8H6HFC6_9AGAR|nr:PIN domain-like protein [Tulosesus angulatus]
MATCIAAASKNSVHGPGALRHLFFKLSRLLRVPANFVFVFDGRNRPSEKRGKQVLASQSLWWYDSAKVLIKAFGFQCAIYPNSFKAPGEAEAELAILNRWGVVHAVMTSDGDAFVFGALRLIRMYVVHKLANNYNLHKPANYNQENPDEYQLYQSSDIAQNIQLTRNGLVFYALAAGGDYDDGLDGCRGARGSALAVSGIGNELVEAARSAETGNARAAGVERWRRAIQTADNLQLSPTLQKILLDGINGAEAFPKAHILDMYARPVTLYTHSEYMPDSRTWTSVQQPDINALVAFCCSHLGWSNPGELQKRLRSNVWEGVVLRMVFSVSLVSALHIHR